MTEQGSKVRKRTPLSTWVIDVGVFVLIWGVVPGLVSGEGPTWLALVGAALVAIGFALRSNERKRV